MAVRQELGSMVVGQELGHEPDRMSFLYPSTEQALRKGASPPVAMSCTDSHSNKENDPT